MLKTQNIDLRLFLGDLRKYFVISFCPVLVVLGLQIIFLALKMLVSSLYKPKNWRKPKICSYDRFRVICVNTSKSLFVQFWWFLGSKMTTWHKKVCIYPLQTLELKKNQNIDLQSFDGEFPKYFRVCLWSCFDHF